MDQQVVDKYHKIPSIDGKWKCPECKKILIINRPRLKKTQIKQHLATYLHTRNAKEEEKTRSRIEELEEMVEALMEE